MIRAANKDTGYRTSFANGNTMSVADMPIAKGGGGDGFGPHDLLEAALATCMVITARKYAGEHRLSLSSIECEVRMDRTVAGSVRFDYQLTLDGALTPAQEQGLRESVSRCPVARTLTGAVALCPSV